MSTVNYKTINKKIIWSWCISRFILLIILGGILFGISITVKKNFSDFNWIINLILYSSLALLVLNVLLYPIIEFKQWRYNIAEDEIEIIHGIFTITTTLIPILRIQHVSIEQGPINKLFKLTSVMIFTAGGNHKIVGLTIDEANKIIEYLNKRIIKELKEECESLGDSNLEVKDGQVIEK